MNNLLIVFLRVVKFAVDLIGVSLFLIIILGLLNNDLMELDLKYKKIELSFLNDLSFQTFIILTLVTFFIKFILSLLINFSDFKIKYKIYIFTLKLALRNFYLNKIKDIISKDYSKVYRSITTEIKFTSIYITSIFSAFANFLILLLSLTVIFLLIGNNIFLIMIFLISSLGIFSSFFSKKLQIFGNQRMKYNLQFYNFFHNSLGFIRQVKILNKSQYIISKLNNIKEKEWKAGYLAKFLQSSTPHIIDLVLIFLVLTIIYSNKFYFLKENSEIILVIILMMRTMPYIKELQANLNEINLYEPSFLTFSPNFIRKKNAHKIPNKISLKKIEIQTIFNNKDINFTINKGEKILIYNKSVSILEIFLSNCIDLNAHGKGNLYLNNKYYPKRMMVDTIGNVGYCDDKLIMFDVSLVENITLSSQALEGKKLKNFTQICEILNIKNLNRNQVLDKNKITQKTKIKIGIARALYNGEQLFIFNNSFKTSVLGTKLMEKILKYIDGKFLIVLSNEKNNLKNLKKLIY